MTGEIPLPNKQLPFALGRGFNLGKAKNRTLSLKEFFKLFEKPLVSGEKFHEYKELPDKQQAHLKGMNGWYMRAHIDAGKRNRNSILSGGCLTYDLDYLTPDYLEEILAGRVAPELCFMLHTTRSHTPLKPRARLILPIVGTIESEDYVRASRIVRLLLDPEGKYTDKVSHRVAQMMYMPTVSRDMAKEYHFYVQRGELTDWRKVVDDWEEVNGSSTDLSNLPRLAGEDDLREVALEAEDPLDKEGPVGNFCRAYTITELIEGKDGEEGLLSEHYIPTENENGVITRMTYLHGTTSNGAVVYDDKFVFSHHGSDPAQDQLMNAYDLVRCHLFKELDDKIDPDTPMNQRPSVKAMTEWMTKDTNYQIAVVESKYDLEEMFSDEDDRDWVHDGADDSLDRDAQDLLGERAYRAPEAAEILGDEHDDDFSDLLGVPFRSVYRTTGPRYARTVAEKPPKNWVASELELTKDGDAKSTLHNIATIITNDPRFFRKIAYNEFNNQLVLLSDVKTKSKVVPTIVCREKENGMLWQDSYDLAIRAVIEGPNGPNKPGYGFKVSDRDLVGGVKLAARNNSFHPIRELIDKWGAMEHPEESVIDTFLQRHVGAPDTTFTRQAFRMMMIASVARIIEPGCKFDYALILEGPQGIGKSTIIKLIYGSENFGEIDVDLKDRKAVAEQISGKWGCELPEMSSFHKSDHNEAKHFLRRTDDDVRLSYDRTVTRLPRQSVMWGTTNDRRYLSDPTGNRSYWPIACDGRLIDFAQVLRERDALWTEAVHAYWEMRRNHNGDLPLTLSGEALDQAEVLQENARKEQLWEAWLRQVCDWADEPVPLSVVLQGLQRTEDALDDSYDPDMMVQRVGFIQQDALTSALEFHVGTITDNMKQLTWGAVADKLPDNGWLKPEKPLRVGGRYARWFVRADATRNEVRQGWRAVTEEEEDLL